MIVGIPKYYPLQSGDAAVDKSQTPIGPRKQRQVYTYIAAASAVLLTVLGSYLLWTAGMSSASSPGARTSLERYLSPTRDDDARHLGNVTPINVWSHNDEWRADPLFDALRQGCTFVEADVWLVDGQILVGHNAAMLTPGRSLRNLYLDPLHKLVAHINARAAQGSSVQGVFAIDENQPLHLCIDIKVGPNQTAGQVFQALQSELRSLREAGYLTTYDTQTETWSRSAITVVGTGATPMQGVLEMTQRDIFFDVPMSMIADSATIDSTVSVTSISDYQEHVNWNGREPHGRENAIQVVKSLIKDSKKSGILSRFWNTPSWPIYARDAVWRMLLDAGVDVLNADDLVAAASF
ncbi:uncharacterized protein L969DRAFT_51253 [Mixia osmundae IAM 14324]|uniref:Altered inheritance of mitochondria protein 6 n=1 Tax=Mixia osmundae (strain CBS 9802 / IAM 14324 / JCM 22182 / KY 12970) TaxID=764103 RepID=G7E7Z2_MIXOS|nr:uncharacterized protein L969DRAFT_51253 [Mixia osmundae IAM 14324]KEI38551.1 hypothetical protein L969DRAFT_51253 [Mixia osmundae IAM 14324]GAA98952.1 hypothetical protein E5Q_05640 [Mixia osmundae IAM 14324]